MFEAVDWFKQDAYAYDSAYDKARNSVNWKQLNLLSDQHIGSVVLKFLNDWKCRIPVTATVIREVRNGYSDVRPYVEALQAETLENTNFEQSVTVANQPYKISFGIYFAIRRMTGVGERFRHVAASKLLHMVLPGLFVMWDNFIIDGYNLSADATSYSYSFMPKMQREVSEAIDTYIVGNGGRRIDAIAAIRSHGSGKTLAKLVDEFNYWKFTRPSRK